MTVQTGTVTSTVAGGVSTINIGTFPNYSANVGSIQGFQSAHVIGAASGTGTGVVSAAYGLLSNLTINATGQLTTYYHLKLNTPTVSGVLTTRYSLWSEDPAAVMYHAGSIGIGTTAPAYQLQLSTDSAGKPSTNTWTVVSDERIKEDIELANLDICYAAIKNIPLKRFKWKDEVYSAEQVGDRRKLGWIAQDVEAVFPKAVRIKEFKYNQKFEETIIPAIEDEFDDDGNVIKEGQPQSIDKKLISEDVIEDCRDLNADQLYAAMYGAVQKLISKVEALEDTVAILKDGVT
jgi:hypothetical protein